MANTILLKKKINKSGYKIGFIAEQLEITYFSLLKKINNKTEFKCSEIKKLCNLLNIDIQEREEIFFNLSVE